MTANSVCCCVATEERCSRALIHLRESYSKCFSDFWGNLTGARRPRGGFERWWFEVSAGVNVGDDVHDESSELHNTDVSIHQRESRKQRRLNNGQHLGVCSESKSSICNQCIAAAEATLPPRPEKSATGFRMELLDVLPQRATFPRSDAPVSKNALQKAFSDFCRDILHCNLELETGPAAKSAGAVSGVLSNAASVHCTPSSRFEAQRLSESLLQKSQPRMTNTVFRFKQPQCVLMSLVHEGLFRLNVRQLCYLFADLTIQGPAYSPSLPSGARLTKVISFGKDGEGKFPVEKTDVAIMVTADGSFHYRRGDTSPSFHVHEQAILEDLLISIRKEAKLRPAALSQELSCLRALHSIVSFALSDSPAETTAAETCSGMEAADLLQLYMRFSALLTPTIKRVLLDMKRPTVEAVYGIDVDAFIKKMCTEWLVARQQIFDQREGKEPDGCSSLTKRVRDEFEENVSPACDTTNSNSTCPCSQLAISSDNTLDGAAGTHACITSCLHCKSLRQELRYTSISGEEGRGLHAAIPHRVYQVIAKFFNGSEVVECFASPFNRSACATAYMSAFPDLDKHEEAGYLGNFFKLHKLPECSSICFVANPPFIIGIIELMFTRIKSLLTRYAETPQTWIIVLPDWDHGENVNVPASIVRRMINDASTVALLGLPAHRHFYEARNHQQQLATSFESITASVVIYMQNRIARSKNNRITDPFLSSIHEAFTAPSSAIYNAG